MKLLEVDSAMLAQRGITTSGFLSTGESQLRDACKTVESCPRGIPSTHGLMELGLFKIEKHAAVATPQCSSLHNVVSSGASCNMTHES